MKHEVVIRRIAELLEINGPQSTTQIMDHLNATTKFGINQHQAANILPKCGKFKKMPYTAPGGNAFHKYTVMVWGLRDSDAPS